MGRTVRIKHANSRLRSGRFHLVLALTFLLADASASAQTPRIQKISSTEGGFTGVLHDGDFFGTRVVSLGDLDGDGVTDIAVGAPSGYDLQGNNRGSVWILFLDRDGTVKDSRQIRVEDPKPGSRFGMGLGTLGDFDGDGRLELDVTSNGADGQGGSFRLLVNRHGDYEISYGGIGTSRSDAVFIAKDSLLATGFWKPYPLPDGTVQTGEVVVWSYPGHFRLLITSGQDTLWDDTQVALIPGLSGRFGYSVAELAFGDEQVLTAGAPYAKPQGAVFLFKFELFRSATRVIGARVRHWERIDAVTGSLAGIDAGNQFGAGVASAGDLDGDGREELIVGAPGDDEGGQDGGAVWVVFLHPDGSFRAYDKLSSRTRSELEIVDDMSRFGSDVASLGDLNGDGVVDLAVGALGDDDGGPDRGAVYILFNLDDIRPIITLEAQQSAPIPADASLPIAAHIKAGPTGISEVDLVFSRGGDREEFSAPMSQTAPDVYSGNIPSFSVGERGVEYYVTATSKGGLQRRLPETGFFSVRVKMPEGLRFTVPGGALAGEYRLVSIPLTLDSPSASSVLQDDLGPYDRSRWRFFGNSRRGELTEFGEDSLNIEPGTAFWLLAKDHNATIGTGPGTSVRTDQPFRIPLRSGWNFVANPFAFTVPTSNIGLASRGPLDLLGYDGSWVSAGLSIEPFSGYIVYSTVSSDTLLIDPNLREAASGKHSTRAAVPGLDQLDWSIRISATKGHAGDEYNVLGVSYAASDGWDELDRPEPPPVWDYVSVHFPHDDWGGEASRFRTDVRSTKYQAPSTGELDNTVWIVGVSAATPGLVDLTFEGIESVPRKLGVWLHDPASGAWQDLRVNRRFTVAVVGESGDQEMGSPWRQARMLEIRVGPAGEVPTSQHPTTGLELSPFPNPFSQCITIAYGLPGEAEVSLSVFNALGQRIATLTEAVWTPAGRHSVVWDAASSGGNPVSPGMYIVRLQAGGATRSSSITMSH